MDLDNAVASGRPLIFDGQIAAGLTYLVAYVAAGFPITD
jgi:hypothetical protein